MRDEEASKMIELQVYEIKVLRVTLRQYCTKVDKIEYLSWSVTGRENILFRRANAMLQDNDECLSNDVKSDSDVKKST